MTPEPIDSPSMTKAARRGAIAARALAAAAACVALPVVAACPADRDATGETLLTVRIGTQSPVRLDRAAIERLTDPARYLGSADAFIDRVLNAARAVL